MGTAPPVGRRDAGAAPLNVIIAGGGPAAIEAALALDRVAGGQVRTTILTPEPAHLHLPMTVLAVRGLRQRPPTARHPGIDRERGSPGREARIG